MEIERLGENKIRCALSEEEIREMGYNIDEIIGNTEVTQEFMRAVVELVEEQGNISMQNISPVVKAELLQDHSMAITFGGDSEMSFKNLVDTVGQLMNQLAPEKLSEFRQMNKEEKQSAIDDFLEKYKAKHSQDAKKTETEDANGTEQKEDNEIFETSVPFSLEFSSLDEMLRLIRLAPFTEKMPTSSLYKFQQKYYLVMDLIHFSREELRPFAFTIVEYTDLEENIGKEVQVDMYEVKRGDIYFADLTGIEHHCGSEQTGWRPVMIVQNDVGNYYSTTTIIATITSKIKGSQPTHVYLESGILDKDSIVCLEQLKTIDKQRLGRFICNVGDSIMERVNGAIQISLGINNNIDKGVGNERPKII